MPVAVELGHRLDVGAGGEDPLTAVEDDGADVVPLGRPPSPPRGPPCGALVDRVHLRPVEADRAHAVLHLQGHELRHQPCRHPSEPTSTHGSAWRVKRPSLRDSDSDSPKVSESASWVRTSSAGPAATTSPAAQQQRVGVARRDLLDVVGDQHLRRRVVVPREVRQAGDEVLAAAEVEAGARLVEQQQLRVGHQRAGDLGPLALALAEGAEGPVGELRDAPLLHEHPGAGQVVDVVALAPPPDDGVPGRHHDVAGRLGRRDALGERGAGQPDPRPQLEDVDRAEGLPQQPHLAARRVHLRGGQREQRRLPRPVRAEHHPAVVGLDGPVDAAQQVGLPPHDVDPGHPDDRHRWPSGGG